MLLSFSPDRERSYPIGGTVIIAKLDVTMAQCCTVRSDRATSEVMLPFLVRVLPVGPDRESFSSFVSLPEPIDLRIREADTVEEGVQVRQGWWFRGNPNLQTS